RQDLGGIGETPARELRPVREIEVLGEGVVLPAARLSDALAPPQAGGAVEVEVAAGSLASGVLDPEVPVEEQRLDPRQGRVFAVVSSVESSSTWISRRSAG